MFSHVVKQRVPTEREGEQNNVHNIIDNNPRKNKKGEKSTKHRDRFRLRYQREDNESETGMVKRERARVERERKKKSAKILLPPPFDARTTSVH